VIAVALIAGCSSSKSHPPTTTTLPRPAVTLPSGVTGVAALPTDIPNSPSLRRNVEIGTCTSAPGGWEASGGAINPSGSTVTYTITIFFTTGTATVIGTGQTKVTVKPGAHQTWTVVAHFGVAPGTLCVLRGVG
jgi:hypothetical protein